MKYQLDASHIDDIPSAVLYRRAMDHYPKSSIGCFVINDDWSEQALLDLKKKSEAWFLVGLQTNDHEYEHLDMIEGIIRCQPDEVNDVIKLLDINSASTIIGIDVVDIKSLFDICNSFKFVQASATGEYESDLIKVAAHKLINKLEKVHNIKALFVGMCGIQSSPLETCSYISETVEALLSNDDVSIYYCSSMIDELSTFRLKAIYAEE
ncbi:hypothetical protein [Psychrobacter sp. ANT_WB68]|uniref:hypothetical protein n=1 Tax=Psychrobacter sp. ANT_WB68 TaxID=2597355 RepID=UPI0011F28CCC|nr:hypothetical protein [Psychrobacter sp. ANT_WB68]KAA0915621.1 hypothetical protein FQ084_03485 [Psychrobacter sp. ANT_WB68]